MKEKKGRMIKIVVAVAIIVLFVWFFIIYPWGYFNKNENKLKEAAKHYFEINYRELPENNEIKTLSLSELSKQKYITITPNRFLRHPSLKRKRIPVKDAACGNDLDICIPKLAEDFCRNA